MRAFSAFTSGRRLYEKWPFCGLENESGFLTRFEGSTTTSGPAGGGVGVVVGVGVEGDAGVPPSSNKSGPWPSPLTMSAHERGPGRRDAVDDAVAAPPWLDVEG